MINLVGNTPMVELNYLSPNPNVKIFAKLEGHNPGGSVKDRPALNMIKSAWERGDLKKGMTLIEATSGNTGIALALMARVYGLDIEIVMPENATVERIQTMKAFGAKVILTPKEGSMEASIDYVNHKIENNTNYYVLNQFSNPDNYLAHYKTTGPEIWKDSNQNITHFVATMGTTGTIMGVSRFLKEQNQNIKIIGVQPKDGVQIPGIRKWPEAYLPKIYEKHRVDQIIEVSDKEAKSTTLRLAREEAIFAGMSSGGSTFAALEVAKTLDSGVIVCIICDKGDRYLSTGLFE